ncbi:MAG: bifunctional D-glycero-beta-D-manno-heptose-7-phosphate kinase/D-glycero-beta-D-manno-heptose 1-phosphate adenylyltransferase HldE [Luminiphilus sp.]|nr:bifunctional D-glycero-beta-D-manno-heptose-7-phosphate kinase/D-glycero-beta-D-manno-heptose 1-phosphate adenylyltransferase HldE [Luminiphilus sp.]
MSICPEFDTASILVVGDVMLDRFWSGGTDRVSPEAPVPVVRVNDNSCRAGGAGNVAVNIAALGGRATLSGLCGEDEAANLLRNVIEAAGVTWAVCPSAPETIVKLRVMSRNQQLLRMDFESSMAPYADDLFSAFVKAQLDAVDTIIFSDYAKGTLAQVQGLIAQAKSQGKKILIDPKGKDLTRYRGATLLTPNLAEFEAVVGHCKTETEMIDRGTALLDDLMLEALLITRSERGMTLLQRGQTPLHLPAKAREVFDVTGAGDTVIAVLAAALSAGESLENSTRLANVAAGLVVGKLGTATVSRDEIIAGLSADSLSPFLSKDRVVTETELVSRVAAAKASGEKVIMTNGCFDILHRGHIDYLCRARALGHRLIVAVNDDASVAALKGPTRPVNPLDARMELLAALRCVDWVVSFSSETPADLIAAIAPDVLVKGGDYRPKEIAGADAVLANGGQVEVLSFVEGFSTTALIEALQR